MKTLYLSKYALTKGVQEVREWKAALETGLGAGLRASATHVFPKGSFSSCQLGVDIHETREAAEAKGEQMRLKKIASLRAQIAALEARK